MQKKDHHEKWMRVALAQARIAASLGEVPIGAVIVRDDKVIAKAYNLREFNALATAHAEILAINQANEHLQKWRLEDVTLYVTLEPCAMCAGAIILSRIKTVVYGATDLKAGCAGSLMNLLTDKRLNHQPEIIVGILEEECSACLKAFFAGLRKKNKLKKSLLE